MTRPLPRRGRGPWPYAEGLSGAHLVTKHNFAPMSLDDGLMPVPLVSGQTVKLAGTEQQLTAYQVQDVKRKCVVAVQNKIIDTYVVTAVANTVETD